ESRHAVDERDADLNGRTAGLAGDRNQPALGLEHEVVAGAIARRTPAEPGDRAVDRCRIARVHGSRIEPESPRCTRPEVLEHDVGRCAEIEDERASLGPLEVDRDAPLAAVDGE